MLRYSAGMKRRQVRIGLALFLCLFTAACAPDDQSFALVSDQQCTANTGEMQRYRVASVVDGDTLRLTNGDKVRIIGINTPELARDGNAAEPLARQAQGTLERLIGSRDEVWLESGAEPRDKYGRRLAHAFNADGDNLAGLMLARGLGFQVAIAPNFGHLQCLHKQEAAARKASSGVWAKDVTGSVSQLRPGQGGFHLIRDQVTRVSFKDNGWWVQLGGKLGVKLDRDAQAHFQRAELQSLQGQTVEVRGWVVPMPGDWWMLNLDHPQMLRREW